jgi:26S proteasome regulatory subunit N2
MCGRSSDSYNSLKETLFTDFSVAGEAVGYAMGLVMFGSAYPTCAEEMLTYAKETHHENIIRGLAMGLAFIFYGRQEEADSTIVSLLAEKASDLL